MRCDLQVAPAGCRRHLETIKRLLGWTADVRNSAYTAADRLASLPRVAATMTSAAADTSRLSSLSLASRCSPPPCNMAAAPSVGEAGRVRRLVGEEGKQTNLITAAEVLECFSEVNVPLRLLWMMLYKVLKDFESVAPTRLNPMPRDNKELLDHPCFVF
mmetsp:Transcript_26833/g.58175  ORF Transcript_26833/g.58175 Transcript_26833/m.58175 type:complete len:159 (-) Transcript_26833:574-1050(-)